MVTSSTSPRAPNLDNMPRIRGFHAYVYFSADTRDQARTVFGELIPWLAMQRGGLVVFVHPIHDIDLVDHRDLAMWMGAVRPLELSMLRDVAQLEDS